MLEPVIEIRPRLKRNQKSTEAYSNDKVLILFAVGGTGGHIFPAQALAAELMEKNDHVEILFAGAHLDTNRFLDKSRFRHREVLSATPFGKNPFRAFYILLKGIVKSLQLLKREKPSLVVGFGSYHSFPLLCAAKLFKIPFVLFEADTIPGKVNRFFSKYARFTGICFPQSAKYLKGNAIPVAMPNRYSDTTTSATHPENARTFLGLVPSTFTLLVFGGSQGAQGINRHIPSLLNLLRAKSFPFQLIHITGNEKSASEMHALCQDLQIPCYVKNFEMQMHYLWRAATLAIGRSGASTLSEMMQFEVPGIIIPYPHSSDAHQVMNADFFVKDVQGGSYLLEENVTPEALCDAILDCEKKLEYYKTRMRIYKQTQQKLTLSQLIHEHFALH